MEKTDKTFFTIITSTLNVINTIERCVKSVAEQTFRDYEHIIVDGASADGTVEFLNLRKELFSVFISEPDTGIYNAWNKALEYVRGEWILFLGADDILADEDVLGDVAAFITENKTESGIVYGDIIYVSKNSYQERQLNSVPPEKIGLQSYLMNHPILPPHPAVFHHKNLFRENLFDESFKIAADAKFLMRVLLLERASRLYFPRVVNKMTLDGISTTNHVKIAKEQFKLMDDLMYPYSKLSFFWVYFKAYLKLILNSLLGRDRYCRVIDSIRRIRGLPTLWS